MSLSESRCILARGSSEQADPAQALREGLSKLGADLARQGGAPGDVLRLFLHAPVPSAYHLARREMDLAWREVFGGLRWPILYRTAASGLLLEAEADVQPAGALLPVWKDMTRPELARAYSPRLQVADMQDVFRNWNADGATFAKEQMALTLRYGASQDELLDFYPAQTDKAPLWIFLHGGYWQACTKDQHGQFAQGMLRHGFAVANLDYGLSPQVPLAQIVVQIRHALEFLVQEAKALGFAPDQIHLAGHSAGAHLAAMAVTDPSGPKIQSALLLSGVFDLEPLLHLPLGRIIGLEGRNCRDLSPIWRNRPDARIGLALGALETDEFKRQSAEMAAHWGALPPLHIENAHHFNILDGLRAEGPLLQLALQTAAAQT